MSTARLQSTTDPAPTEAQGWLHTVFARQRHLTAHATQGYRDRLRCARYRYRTRRRQKENECLEEHVAEALPRATTGWTIRDEGGHLPIQTLVSNKKSSLKQRVTVSSTDVARPRKDIPMFGNAVIAADQTYHIRTKLVLVVGMGVVEIVVPQKYS